MDMTRYTLLLEPGALHAIERLQEAYGLKTKADAYELAVRVLQWATEQQIQGRDIGSLVADADGKCFQPLLMPAMNMDRWK